MRTATKGPVYRIETDRLVMRCWNPEDARLVRAALDNSDSHLRPYIPFMRHEPRTLTETAEWLRHLRAGFDLDEHYRFGIFDPTEETLIGEVMLLDRAQSGDREIGYWIDESHGGKGYATEAAAAMTRIAFAVDDVDRVEIQCAPENVPSARVAEKLGFVHEATLSRRTMDTEGQFRDLMVWTLFRDRFSGSAASTIHIRPYDCLGLLVVV